MWPAQDKRAGPFETFQGLGSPPRRSERLTPCAFSLSPFLLQHSRGHFLRAAASGVQEPCGRHRRRNRRHPFHRATAPSRSGRLVQLGAERIRSRCMQSARSISWPSRGFHVIPSPASRFKPLDDTLFCRPFWVCSTIQDLWPVVVDGGQERAFGGAAGVLGSAWTLRSWLNWAEATPLHYARHTGHIARSDSSQLRPARLLNHRMKPMPRLGTYVDEQERTRTRRCGQRWSSLQAPRSEANNSATRCGIGGLWQQIARNEHDLPSTLRMRRWLLLAKRWQRVAGSSAL